MSDSGVAPTFWKQNKRALQIAITIAAVAIAVAIPFIQAPLCSVSKEYSNAATYRVTVDREQPEQERPADANPSIAQFTLGPVPYGHIGEIERTESTYNAPEQKEDWGRRYWCDVKATDYFLVLFTLALAIFSYLLWVETGRLAEGADDQSRKMVEAIGAMNKVAKETANVAIATNRTADTAQRSLLTTERAFVFMKYLSSYAIFLNHVSQTKVGYVLNPMWTNSGTTPARYCKLSVDWCAHDGELPTGFLYFYKRDVIETTIGPSSEVGGGLIEIDSTSLSELLARTKRIYIWGKAEYRDIFADTQPHFTTFCVRMDMIRGNGPDGGEFVGFVPYGSYNSTEKEM